MKDSKKLIRYFSIIDRYAKQMMDKQLAKFGLNSSNHMFLMKIAEHQEISQDKLISMFHIHPSNITRGLATLEKNNLIKRTPRAEDKRSYTISLTEMGEKIVPDVYSIVSSTNALLSLGLSDDEIENLEETLDKVMNNLVEKCKDF